jgi:epoxyqueuosine reductase QueG
MDKTLTEKLKEKGLAAGAHKVGVAHPDAVMQLDPQSDARRLLRGARSIVIALVADPPAIRTASDGEEYMSLAYPGYQLADGAAAAMCGLLKKKGYKIKEIVRVWHKARDKDGKSIPTLQLKSAAVAAGFGQIGLHTLLITPNYGPRVRLSGFVTDAPLEPDEPFADDLCDDCGACARACPSGAIVEGKTFGFLTCSAYLFAGLSIKELRPAMRSGDLETLRCNAERLAESVSGWVSSVGRGRRLYYTCGNCLRVCAAEARFNKHNVPAQEATGD